jgi:hypothetical protein
LNTVDISWKRRDNKIYIRYYFAEISTSRGKLVAMARRMMSPEDKRGFMLDTPVYRLIPRMALPSIAVCGELLYNLAEPILSVPGTYATGAVGVNAS